MGRLFEAFITRTTLNLKQSWIFILLDFILSFLGEVLELVKMSFEKNHKFTVVAVNAALEKMPPSNKRRTLSIKNLINAAAFIRIIMVCCVKNIIHSSAEANNHEFEISEELGNGKNVVLYTIDELRF